MRAATVCFCNQSINNHFPKVQLSHLPCCSNYPQVENWGVKTYCSTKQQHSQFLLCLQNSTNFQKQSSALGQESQLSAGWVRSSHTPVSTQNCSANDPQVRSAGARVPVTGDCPLQYPRLAHSVISDNCSSLLLFFLFGCSPTLLTCTNTSFTAMLVRLFKQFFCYKLVNSGCKEALV